MLDHRTNPTSGTARAAAEGSTAFGRVSHCTRSAAFTMVELMVVVAIIAILAALLSTAFNTTKARSQKVICLSNVRQLASAWKLYIEDNDDLLPVNMTVPSPLWVNYSGRRLSSNSWAIGNPKEDVNSDHIIRGSLFPYAGKSIGIYHCPSDKSTVLNRPDVLRNRSYSMSAYLNGDDIGDSRVKTKDSELINGSPEKIFVFIEEHQDSPWLGNFLVLPREPLTLSASVNWTSIPSDRHNQGCNLSFADGHVEYWKWFWPKDVEYRTKLTANGHELRDVRRLQGAIPAASTP